MTTSIVSQFLINSSHYQGSNVYKYTLPQGRYLTLTNNHSVAVSSCSIYNSTFNIRKEWNNNKVVLLFEGFNQNAVEEDDTIKYFSTYTDDVTGVVLGTKCVEITILDGYYDVVSLDAYLQNICERLGLYLQSTNGGQNMFFIQALTNPQRYKCQINLFTIPNTLPTGYMLPSNASFSLPSQASTLQVYFPTVYNNSKYGNLGTIFGFKSGVMLPLSGDITTDSANLSQVTPVVSPISTYLLACNLVKNEYAIPNDVLLQLNLGSSKFGGIVPYNDQPIYVTCQNQQTQSIVITLYDENYNALDINDAQFSLVLSIKEDIQRISK